MRIVSVTDLRVFRIVRAIPCYKKWIRVHAFFLAFEIAFFYHLRGGTDGRWKLVDCSGRNSEVKCRRAKGRRARGDMIRGNVCITSSRSQRLSHPERGGEGVRKE
jgi:hypothetical protein